MDTKACVLEGECVFETGKCFIAVQRPVTDDPNDHAAGLCLCEKARGYFLDGKMIAVVIAQIVIRRAGDRHIDKIVRHSLEGFKTVFGIYLFCFDHARFMNKQQRPVATAPGSDKPLDAKFAEGLFPLKCAGHDLKPLAVRFRAVCGDLSDHCTGQRDAERARVGKQVRKIMKLQRTVASRMEPIDLVLRHSENELAGRNDTLWYLLKC